MAILQTSYGSNPAPLPPGSIISGETSNRITRTCEDANGIAFGKAVFRGALSSGATATVGDGSGFLGIAIATAGEAAWLSGATDAYEHFQSVPILTKGVIQVETPATVAKGDAAFSTADGALTNLSGDNFPLDGATFDSNGTGAVALRLVRAGE